MRIDDKITEYFRTRARGVVAVYVFGSQASGKSIPGSDVDIAVLFDTNDPNDIRAGIEAVLAGLPRVLKKDVHPVAMKSISNACLQPSAEISAT